MPLIIEDSSIVVGANSFVTLEEARSFCDQRGLVLPDDDIELEKLLVKAADFLSSLEVDFQGERVDYSQELPFPREEVYIYNTDISGTIPNILKNAQSRLAFDASINELIQTGSGRVVKKEGVGPLTIEYADDGVSNPQVQLSAALNILSPLFKYPSLASIFDINICATR